MRVLNLGAGGHSSAVYLLAATGEIEPIDYAVFADTGEEPSWVYENVADLAAYRTPDGKAGAPILTRWLCDKDGNRVRLGDNLIEGNAGRFASIPAFIKHLLLFDRQGRNAQGKGKRQCTREFKIDVVELTIRRELLALKFKQPYKGERITQVFGFAFDEGPRIFNTKIRLAHSSISVGEFPLWDLMWSRPDCDSYLKELPGWGREVLPSACTFCPLVNDAFRRMVRDRDPAGHARACYVDRRLREDSAASKMLEGELYVHRRMIPLEDVDLDADDEQGLLPMMTQDCEGFCGH